MGVIEEVKCKKCGTSYTYRTGGGFQFHELFCDKCGEAFIIPFDDILDIHSRYLKGLPGPFSVATAEIDRQLKEDCPDEPITEDEYHQMLEKYAGSCKCGGKFRFRVGPPKCPNCGSTEYENDGMILCYD